MNFHNTNTGSKKILVQYKGLETNFYVNIIEQKATILRLLNPKSIAEATIHGNNETITFDIIFWVDALLQICGELFTIKLFFIIFPLL